MRRRSFGLLALMVLSMAPLQAEVRFSDNLEEILAGADRDTLVVLDIWETLMLPAQWIGGPRSEKELVRVFEKQVCREEAEIRTAELLRRVHSATSVVPVDQNCALFIRNLQNEGVHVIGQTCDPSSLGYLTGDQLALLGIDLKRTAIPRYDVELKEGDYMEGILFVHGEEKKGSSLIALLEAIEVTPKRILFVDNEEKHVRDVDSALKGRFEVDAVVYQGAKGWESGYRQDVVDVQAHYLGRILSDEEANKLIDAGIES